MLVNKRPPSDLPACSRVVRNHTITLPNTTPLQYEDDLRSLLLNLVHRGQFQDSLCGLLAYRRLELSGQASYVRLGATITI